MSDSSARAELVKKLNAEGDFAADYLEELLDIADLDGDIEISVEADRAAVAVVTDGTVDRRLKRLIGDNGEVLDSLQELARLAVQAKTGERSRLMLDIAGHRAAHREEIAAIAQEAIAAVFASGQSVALKPMNPFERKVVHDFAANAGLISDSEGIGPARHVIVSLPSAGGQDEAGAKGPATADSAEEAEDSDGYGVDEDSASDTLSADGVDPEAGIDPADGEASVETEASTDSETSAAPDASTTGEDSAADASKDDEASEAGTSVGYAADSSSEDADQAGATGEASTQTPAESN